MLKLLDFAALEKSFHLAIISDSNQVYIESVLNHFNVRHLFTHIITNPAHFDEGGCLRVRRMIPANATQHNCPNGCSLNICKGNEIDKLIPHYDRILYVGDGRNDFCPSTKLRPVADAAFIRKDFGCDKYMIKNNICLKNKLVKWSSYEELFELIKGET